MEKVEVVLSLERLKKAYSRLVEAVDKVEDELDRDGAIQRFGLIGDDEILLDMLEDGNRSSHIYSQEEAEKIFERISKVYVKSIRKVINKLENRL